MTGGAVAAIDLGASSGRVVLGRIDDGIVRLDILERFANTPVRVWEGSGSGLHWNLLELYRPILQGLRRAVAAEPGLRSIGIDSWGLDYGILRDGALLGNPYSYRDERTAGGVRATHELIAPEELYAISGLQFMPINSIYQFTADRLAGRLQPGDTALLIPDLIGYWLTGEVIAERTNASTTGLLDVRARTWSASLADRLGLSAGLLPPIVDPGTEVGTLLRPVEVEVGASVPVVTVGSHDTASAVVGVPALDDDYAYISCGTWALVGVELDGPVLDDAARVANFTNEAGLDGRIRFLQNITGLWLQSESIRTWERDGRDIDLTALLEAAEALGTGSLFDANDPRLLPPGDMPARIAQCCREAGQPVPQNPAEFVRAINQSLAEAFAVAVRTAADLSGKDVKVIHVVGGGSQNALLCRLTADRSGLPVVAGPVEATALGNVMSQARTAGLVTGGLDTLRATVARSTSLRRYEPRSGAR
ncbi:rhamnulokinase family protein [Pseudolysinimonas kribbensis]|uniref:Rhamnulokinase n=1 Tax=Pseudolysinimonas kribbensis TaxID=433641 RepID=A0ABQ6K316_9MICO|nr:rhamnulokinase family protein [Pseudolysinimonas kribbensis]GMA95025.1 rhamnulokinase [Pseudolysinimonas kribbensis]